MAIRSRNFFAIDLNADEDFSQRVDVIREILKAKMGYELKNADVMRQAIVALHEKLLAERLPQKKGK
jgi:hypothetical protein